MKQVLGSNTGSTPEQSSDRCQAKAFGAIVHEKNSLNMVFI
jgi:hypothetical protein